MKNEEIGKIVQPLLDWYHQNKRILPWRMNKDPYRVWVSEIMLQQTRVEAVIPYYERFMDELPTIKDLAKAPEEELMKLWEGLGYYSRVKNLQKAAIAICQEYDGVFPKDFEAIVKLPGIGEYTAGAISSIAFELPRAAVDGNVLRVITRLTENPTDIMDTKLRKQFTKALEEVYPDMERGDFTQSLMELGAMICLPNGAPKCEECPLKKLCGACNNGTWMQYPTKKKKAERKIQEKTVLVIEYQDRIVLRKREQTGVLAGMWELPNFDGKYTKAMITNWLEGNGLIVEQIEKLPSKKHIFSHIEWHMSCYRIVCKNNINVNECTWVSKADLEQNLALPTAFKIIYDSICKGE